ncbi:MAG: hypothetical protein PWP24_368 [Clostridiales bacterium]|nr:hypothetical protein [Clostridiales bacterium]
MHSYLRAVGFSNINTRIELDKIIGLVMDRPTEKRLSKISRIEAITEIKKDFADGMGVAIRGVYDEKGFFHLEHYFPYYKGKNITAREDIVINKRVDTDAYTGMCDDIRLGVSLIFYLQNAIDYIESKGMEGQSRIMPLTLTSLSLEGKILLGLDINDKKQKNKQAENKQRSQLIAEARAGNQEAIDSLTIDDIDMYAMISRRSKTEDIYSIVDTSFIPYGSESDNYSIIGTILSWKLVQNQMTHEEVYQLFLSCNDINFGVCINRSDLIGEPMVGRRFKGTIWMQGNVDFTTL